MFSAVLDRLSAFFAHETQNESDPKERKQILLLPLHDFSVPFVQISDWEKKSSSGSNKPFIKRLNDVKWKYERKLKDSEKSRPKPVEAASHQAKTQLQREYLFLVHYYNTKCEKMFDLTTKSYRESIEIIENMERFVANVDENKYPLSFDVEGFFHALELRDKQIPGVARLEMKTRYIKHRISTSPPEIAVNKQYVKDALAEALKTFDTADGFMSSASFDPIFRDYVCETGHDKLEYNEMLTLLTNFEYSRALNKLSETTKSLAEELAISTKESAYMILYIAASRFLFDEVSTQLPSLLRNDLATGAFVKHCEVLRNSQPGVLKAEKLFTPDQREMTVTQIFNDSEELHRALSYLQTVQFYSCPVDIAWVVTQATQIIDLVIHKTKYRNKHCGGNPTADVPEEYLLTAEMNDFDSVFTYLVMGFAVDPPANATAIATYMNALSSEALLSDFEYARSLVISSIEFLREHDLP